MNQTPVHDSGPDGASPSYRAVVAAADELMLCPDLDTLFRRAVELAREKLALERCSIFVEEDGWARGTYGTDFRGETTDERAFRKPVDEHYGGQVPPPPPEGPSWFVIEGPWREWTEGTHREVGEGWTVLTPIRFSDRPIGVLFNDAAITGAPLNESLQDVVAVYCSMLGNIIERMRSEEALRHSERRARATTDAAMDAIIMLDGEGEIAYANRAAELMFGYGAREVIGKSPVDFLASDEARVAYARELARIRKTGQSRLLGQSIALNVLRKDGGEIPVEYSAASIPIGNEWHCVAIMRDVSKRKQAEEELRRERDLVEATLDTAGALVCVLDREGRIIRFNRACEEVTGYSFAEAVGRVPWEFLVPPGEAETAKAFFGKLPDDGSPARGETHWVTKGGGQRLIVWSNTGLPDANGQMEYLIATGLDVTEHRRAEEAYHALVEQSLQGLIILQDERVVFSNPALCEISGYSAEELKALSPEDVRNLVHPDDQQEVWGRVRDRLAGEAVSPRNEFRAIRKDGTVRWLEAHASIITYRGRPAVQVAYLDVTDRKRAERERTALARLTSRLAAAAAIEEMAAVVREESESLLGWDAHYFAVRAADSNKLRVVSLADTVEGTRVILPTGHLPPAQLSPPIESVLRGESVLINRGIQDPGPALSCFGDTERPSASILYVPVRSGSLVIGILSVQSYSPGHYGQADLQVLQQFADTIAPALERAYAEQSQAESERKYRELVENANSIILNVDTQGHVTFFNEFAQQFFGYEEAEIVGREVVGTIVPEGAASDRSLGRLNKEIFLDPDRYANFESENITKDGRRVWVSWTNKPVYNADAEPMGILHVGHDITERRRLEEQLQRSGRLEAVGRLAGTIAHEFSNVLTGITGHVDLALLELAPESPAAEDLRRVSDLAQRAAGITRQLMAFSRRQRLTPIPLDLNRLIGDLLKNLPPLVGENIELGFVPETPLGQVRADPSHVEQMLVNLAVNARDAMPNGGKLTIETANVTLGPTDVAGKLDLQPGPHVILRVADTGLGMDQETRDRAFEPFFTTKNGGGAGLGLAAVYGIVKQHGGDISVAARRGQGAAFTVYLPRIDAAPTVSRDSAREQTPPRGRETILVVDDEDAIRLVVQRTLETQGYRVFATTSPERALQLFAERNGDITLLLADVVMPGMTGQELYDQLSERNPSLKALYMSGYDGESMLGMDFLAEDLPFIHKPFTAEGLARKVRDVLDSEIVTSR